MGAENAPFTLQAQAGTDIWKKPPTTNIFNAPISRTSTGPLSKFRSARATFWADWTEKYDQGGLLLVPRRRSTPSPTPASPSSCHEKWIKAGVELYAGAPHLSVVSTDRYADWSVTPLPTPNPTGVTIEIVRETDEHGESVWVYYRVGDSKDKTPLREICWIFADDQGRGADDDEWVLDVSPLVARPEKNCQGTLEVRFSEFEVEWAV
ncbi:hypothetical protein DL771_006717 [Monosporascus sp. 5C6A]|nr:hypothetical protein DL771_006717 [Monosporascus sp. 5C6A]